MKRIHAVILAGLLLLSGGLAAQSRVEKPNDLTLELGGKCLIYSLSYQRMIGRSAGLEVGLSYFGGGDSGGSAGVFFASGGVRFYLMNKNAAPCLSAGVVYFSAGTDAGPFDRESESLVYLYAGPGFEYRASGGFVLRGSVNFLIKDGFFVWPGLTMGIAF